MASKLKAPDVTKSDAENANTVPTGDAKLGASQGVVATKQAERWTILADSGYRWRLPERIQRFFKIKRDKGIRTPLPW